MDWGKFVRDNIYDSGSKPPKAEEAAAPVQAPVVNPGVTVPMPVPVMTSVPTPVAAVQGDSALTAQFVEKLRGKLSTSPLNGVLAQFQAALESVADIIPDEGSRFRAAMKMLSKTANMDAAQVGAAYESLIGLLDGEAAKFGAALQNQKATEIDSREASAKAIQAQIEAKQKEIAALMEQRETVAGEIVAQKTKLASAQAGFEGAVVSLKAEVGDSIQKLKIYLPVVAPAVK